MDSIQRVQGAGAGAKVVGEVSTPSGSWVQTELRSGGHTMVLTHKQVDTLRHLCIVT